MAHAISLGAAQWMACAQLPGLTAAFRCPPASSCGGPERQRVYYGSELIAEYGTAHAPSHRWRVWSELAAIGERQPAVPARAGVVAHCTGLLSCASAHRDSCRMATLLNASVDGRATPGQATCARRRLGSASRQQWRARCLATSTRRRSEWPHGALQATRRWLVGAR